MSDTAKTQTPKKARIAKVLWVSVISTFALLVYRQLLGADFFLDDYLHLHLVQQIDNPLTPYFSNLFMGAFFRPGVFVFWKINYLLFGLNASGYYATNILFLIMLLMLTFFVMHSLTGNRVFAGLTTALFTFNPVTTVGVLWLSNRFDLIGTIFYMGALLLFLTYLRKGQKKLYYLSIAVGVFSYFCKEMMITLPVTIVICASFMFGYRSELNWKRFRQIAVLTTPFFTLGVLFVLWRYGIIHSLGGYSGEVNVKLSTAYITMLYNNFSDYFWLMHFKKIFAVYLILFVLLLAKPDFFKNNPLSVLGISLAIVTFLPLVMILRMQAVMAYMTPRFFFLPGIGMTILLASTYDPRSGRFRKALAAVFLVVTLLFFMFNTFATINKWADDRRENVRSMEKVAAFIEQNDPSSEYPTLYYVLLFGNDVALDAGVKLRYPDLLDKGYYLNPMGPTQVIGTDSLHDKVGKALNWPKTFDKNPCDWRNLRYGLVDVAPHDVLARMDEHDDVRVITKDKTGRLVMADLEGVRGLLATKGVFAP